MDDVETIPHDLHEDLEARVRSGRYASTGEVIRAGLQALDREETAFDDLLRRKVEVALADPRPSVPADEVFAELRAYHATKVAAGSRGT